MAATTSGTTTFTLDVDDIIEQALEPVGGEYTAGPEMAKARRALNLILIQLQNKNIPLSKIDNVDVAITVAGGREYTLDASVVDVLELNILDPSLGDGLEIPFERWGIRQYHEIPNKDIVDRPTLWATDRARDAVVLKLWPTPDKSYTAKLLVTKRVEDVTASYQRIDLSYRYLPLLVKWLSYDLSLTREGIDPNKIILLKSELDAVMVDTFDEDRERVDFRVILGGISGKG